MYFTWIGRELYIELKLKKRHLFRPKMLRYKNIIANVKSDDQSIYRFIGKKVKEEEEEEEKKKKTIKNTIYMCTERFQME